MSNKTTTILKSIFIMIIFASAIHAGAVWIAPPAGTPPTNNISQPVNVGETLQFKNGNFVAAGLKATVAGIFEGTLQIIPGAGVGKVLTSDVNGMATWQPAGGGGGGVVVGGDGSGTINYVTKFTGPSTIDDSQIFDNGTNVGIATASPTQKLDVNGNVKGTQFCLPGVNPTGGCISVWPSASNSGGGWTRDPETFTVRLTTSTDKVGIGTSSPTQQLEITKNLKMQDTNSAGTQGVIFFGAERFIHNAGDWNTFVGKNSGNYTNTGEGNSGVGALTLTSLTSGDSNSALGYNALTANTSGESNVAVGKDALKSNTTTSFNTGAGYQALQNNSGGQYNSGLGFKALANNTSGNNNTALGANALLGNASGSNNIGIGYNADVGSNSLTNATAIGANTTVSASNTMVFGNSSITGWGFGTQPGGDAIKVYNGSHLTLSGQWQGPSDRSKKHNILDISYGLNEIMQLRPVSFDWNGTNQHDIGFIAQEVKPIIPEIVSGAEGSMTLSYSQVTVVLTKAIQDLKAENDDLRARLEALKLKLKEYQQ